MGGGVQASRFLLKTLALSPKHRSLLKGDCAYLARASTLATSSCAAETVQDMLDPSMLKEAFYHRAVFLLQQVCI